MRITENAKLRIALTVLLSCILVAGVVLWCFAFLWKDNSVLDDEERKTDYETSGDEGLSFDVEPDYGVKLLDGAWEEGYVITASWTAADGYDASYVDIAGYSWSASWDENYSDGGGEYTGDITEARDYGGEIWNENGNPYYEYVSFGDSVTFEKFTSDPLVEGMDSDDDFYAVGDMASDTVKFPELGAYIWAPFGTPVTLTFTLWDYGGHELSASIRFDYMSYFTVDEFTFYSGEEYDDSSEVLFSASYDSSTGSFSELEIPGSNASDETISDVQELMTPSLEKAQDAENPALWYEAEGSGWSVGTVSASAYNKETMNEWSIELSYEENTYSENSSAETQGSRGSISWDTISDNILGTEGGIPEKTGGAVTKKNLQVFDKALNASAEAMIKVEFKYSGETRLEFGLSFDEYGNLSVGIVGADTSGDVIFNGGV